VAGILPDQHGPLVVQPALKASVFAQVATTVTTSSHNYRIPIVQTYVNATAFARSRHAGASTESSLVSATRSARNNAP
jgi:hypothetical protein